jgi:hypothetical protein
MEVIMRLFKFAAIAVLIGVSAYATSLAIIPPKKSVAAAPATELFSVEISRLAKNSPEASYDAH